MLREVPHVDWFTGVSPITTREVFECDRLGRVAEASTWTGEVTATNPLLGLVAVGLEQDSTGRVHDESYDFTGLGYGTTPIGVTASFTPSGIRSPPARPWRDGQQSKAGRRPLS